jgi:hypothetical protein
MPGRSTVAGHCHPHPFCLILGFFLRIFQDRPHRARVAGATQAVTRMATVLTSAPRSAGVGGRTRRRGSGAHAPHPVLAGAGM